MYSSHAIFVCKLLFRYVFSLLFCDVFSMLSAIVKEWKFCCFRYCFVLQRQKLICFLPVQIISTLVARQRKNVWRLGLTIMAARARKSYNLGQCKMEQLSPTPHPPKALIKARRNKKFASLASQKWRKGWYRCSIYYV